MNDLFCRLTSCLRILQRHIRQLRSFLPASLFILKLSRRFLDAGFATMLRSKLLSAVLQSSASKGLVRGLAAHMPCTSSLASSSCSAVPSPHFGSVDTHHRASAVAVDDSSAPSLPLLTSKSLPMADLLTSSTVLPALARSAGNDEFSADAVDASDLTPGNFVLGSVRPAYDRETRCDGSLTANCNCTSACPCSACRYSRTISPLRFPNDYGSVGGSDRAWAAVPPHLHWARQVRQQLVRSLVWSQSQQTQTALPVVGAVARAFSTGRGAAADEIVITGAAAQLAGI